jgi:transmembrane sensor
VVELNDASSLQTGSAPVVPIASETRAPVQLRVGQSVTVSLEEDLRPAAAPDIVVHSDREVQRLLAWREGLLDFSRTPLKSVVEEVGRHTNLQIEIADPSLGELQFDGIFRVGQVDQLLDALGATFNVKVERIDANHVRLSKQ